ncbi:Homocysteine S-methyltransferase [Lentinula aciculospora]|uniref:Homocysteine S-methyltransferase n=1 Tax=Lentinula aciculospora TaxID=153920 RepID=A0A9W9AWJ8_9AGAR|nr:Homocysteine S-methyltransferase [Lentinula aciculospora]
MNLHSESFGCSPVILDGGFGTTLEQWYQLDISGTHLWSAQAIVNHADVVIETHLAFLRAGADIITTSTYQCSYATFARAGYTTADARRIMSLSVQLASQARQIFRDEQGKIGNPIRDVRIALSLGPFGASLKPAQEFDGFYPPPFGPKAYSEPDAGNCNTFGDDAVAESESIYALAQFHFERLLVLFEDETAWNSIDCVAFETIPLTREIQAIRRAMGLLNDRIATVVPYTNRAKPWWISMVFPDGLYPETSRDGSTRMSVANIVSTAIQNPSPNYPSPSGLGINCTQVEYFPKLISEFNDKLQKYQNMKISDRDVGLRAKNDIFKPWLVLYPNGGDVYNTVARTWVQGSQNGEKHWARTLKESYAPSRIWAGVLLGGCCRTTPTHIQLLKQIVHSSIDH